jgi:hypothetical protein
MAQRTETKATDCLIDSVDLRVEVTACWWPCAIRVPGEEVENDVIDALDRGQRRKSGTWPGHGRDCLSERMSLSSSIRVIDSADLALNIAVASMRRRRRKGEAQGPQACKESDSGTA